MIERENVKQTIEVNTYVHIISDMFLSIFFVRIINIICGKK